MKPMQFTILSLETGKSAFAMILCNEPMNALKCYPRRTEKLRTSSPRLFLYENGGLSTASRPCVVEVFGGYLFWMF